jgi:hypothetical protein
MSIETMLLVESLRVRAIETLHPEGEIGIWCLDDEVVMVRHQAVAMATPTSLSGYHGEESEEPCVVIRV